MEQIFFEDLKKMGIIELADYVRRCRALTLRALDQNSEDIYEQWVLAGEADPRELPLSDVDRKILEENQKVYKNANGKYKYQLAVAYLTFPPSRYYYHTGKQKREITARITGLPLAEQDKWVGLDIAAAAKSYLEGIDRILDFDVYGPELYNYVQKGNRHTGFVYELKNKAIADHVDMETVLRNFHHYVVWNAKTKRHWADKQERAARKKAECDQAVETEENGFKYLKDYGIGRANFRNYCNGTHQIQKPFLVRLAFFLGLTDQRAGKLLGAEGYAFAGSKRYEDAVWEKCLKLGMGLGVADRLAERAKKRYQERMAEAWGLRMEMKNSKKAGGAQ